MNHLVLTVQNIDKTRDVYVDVLGMAAEQFTVANGSQPVSIYIRDPDANLIEI